MIEKEKNLFSHSQAKQKAPIDKKNKIKAEGPIIITKHGHRECNWTHTTKNTLHIKTLSLGTITHINILCYSPTKYIILQ